jgi:cysteine dioxygenase
MKHTLDELFCYLDALCERPALADLVAHLQDLDIDCHDVASAIRFSTKGYTRNPVRSGTWYQVLALCWKNGQRSPIHDHKGSICAVRVLRGTVTETGFAFAPNGHVKALYSRDFLPGEVCGSQDDDLHQVSNLQPGDADLVTLHVYSPPLVWMGTYSMFDTQRRQEPMLQDFTDAAGI